MKLFTIALTIFAVLGLTYASIGAMEGQPPRQNLPPCDISAVAKPTTRIRHVQYEWQPPFYSSTESQESLKRKKEEEMAIEKKKRQDALKERRFLASGTMKSLQQRSANMQIEGLLQNLDNVKYLQEIINSYPLPIKRLLRDQIEAQKDLLDVDDAEELKKIEELNQLETLVNQALALEEEAKEIKKDSPEKEETLD